MGRKDIKLKFCSVVPNALEITQKNAPSCA